MENQHVSQRSASLLSHQNFDRDSHTQLFGNKISTPKANLSISTSTLPPPPPLVSPLPSNAVVFHSSRSPQDCDTSFHKYIDQHFQQDAAILKTHLTNVNNSNGNGSGKGSDNSNTYLKSEEQFVDMEKQRMVDMPNTFWAVLKTDLGRFQGKDNNDSSLWTNDDQQRWDTLDNGSNTSIGAILFLFGFIIPPLWWLGAFWPRQLEQGGGGAKMAIRWQQLNRYFSIGFSIILVIVIIIITVLYGTSH